MPTGCPLPATLRPTLPVGRAPAPRLVRPPVMGDWRYESRPRSRRMMLAAVLVSAGVHGTILFGIGQARKKPAPVRAVSTLQLSIVMPQLQELEELERAPNDDDVKPDLGQLVPMQADVPAPALPTDFVQQLDFASLVERPDLNQMRLLAIPEHIGRPGRLMEGVKIFDLAQLDRQPEPVAQPPPHYPPGLKKQALTGTVRVEFLVDVDGRVYNAFAAESDEPAFAEAGVAGVMKWRFRAGVKNGRRVITRMQVPIIFKIGDFVE